MECHGKFGHSLGMIQHIALKIIFDIFCTACNLATQTVAPTITGFQGIKSCIQYLASRPHKPIFYPSNYYYGSNLIRLTWGGNQVEYYTTQNYLEYHQYADHARIFNIIRPVSNIINAMIGVAVWRKVQIRPDIASDSTGG